MILSLIDQVRLFHFGEEVLLYQVRKQLLQIYTPHNVFAEVVNEIRPSQEQGVMQVNVLVVGTSSLYTTYAL